MQSNKHHITVFEHQSLKLGQHFEDVEFDEPKLKALQLFYGEKGVPYYSLIHNGVKFCEYVGVLQVGNLTIEVLPKADKDEDEAHWRSMLIGMLKSVGLFTIQAPSHSDLSIKHNSILELYFELFLNETEHLFHRGLVKKYRKTEGNSKSLKGTIQFAQHIQKNLTHQERFYVRHTIYDVNHLLHKILYKTLRLLNQINTSSKLHSKIGSLLLGFPEQDDLRVSEALFERIQFDRKSDSYKTAISIARLLLLNYHPDVMTGRNNVLALMFNMNALWEQFVYVSLLKHKKKGVMVEAQLSKSFWRPQSGYRVSIRPDIVLNKGEENCVVLDTKWKNLSGYNPSPDDLRQMFVYHEYFGAQKVALVYPGQFKVREGVFFNQTGKLSGKECSILPLSLKRNIADWQLSIYNECDAWLNKKAISNS